MRRTLLLTITLIIAFGIRLDTASAQTITSNNHHDGNGSVPAFFARRQMGRAHHAGFSLMPASSRTAMGNFSAFPITPMAANPPVVGSGSLGRLTKWTGFSSNSVIGNSTIFEDKFGMVGIGTDTPTSRLTVAGMIETLGGGLKFPDGTIQTTSATGALFAIHHDATLAGNGTAVSPLGLAVPLVLSQPSSTAIIDVTNTAESATGMRATGASGDATNGGQGMVSRGGHSNSGFGGRGLSAEGGGSDTFIGGPGVRAGGGDSILGTGGDGVVAVGGSVEGLGAPGFGVSAFGGDSTVGFGGGGIFASAGSGPFGFGLAGEFDGDVEISGMLSKGGGSFKIDHPLDPENRYLSHSFVESPDMKNIYDGVAKLDSNGELVVEMPEWFSALNRDFRYLLTPVGAPMPGLYIAEELSNNRFKIAGGAAGVKVSWQVTGIRQDAWAKKNRIRVDVEKTDRERGFYLHPEAFDQPEERGIGWVRNAELMKQRKETREHANQKWQ